MNTLLPPGNTGQSPGAVKPDTPSPDFHMARRFLTLLGEGEDWTFQTFGDTGNHDKSLARILHSRDGEVTDQLLSELAELNCRGAGVFVMVNRGDGKGRKTENVTGVRAIFVDLDGTPLSILDNSPLAPHLQVETSPGRFHAYWIIEGLPCGQFTMVQAALAARFGGDLTVKDLPRVMRLPGFYHRKGVPFLTHILQEEGSQPYPAPEFLRVLGIDPTVSITSSPPTTPQVNPHRKIGEGKRNTHLASLAGSMRRRNMSPKAVEDALLAENSEHCDPPLPEEEVKTIARSIARYSPQVDWDCTDFDPTDLEHMDPKTAVEILAALKPLVYDRHRKTAAKNLNVQLSTLDREVEKQRRRQQSGMQFQGGIIEFPPVTPWPEPVDSAVLLEDLVAMIQRFVVIQKPAAYAVALWALVTHCVETVDCAPLLAITSPEKRCGKTTLLALLDKIVARPLPISNVTAAALFRVIAHHQPTLLIDEADTFLKDNDELRGILNSGYTHSTAFVLRVVGDEHEPRCFSTWGFKAIACIGTLPPTLADRSIEIRLARKHPGESAEKLRESSDQDWQQLRERLLRFSQDAAPAVKSARPQIPVALHDRAADSWAALFALADIAGGPWPERARQAALALSAESGDQSLAVGLLADIRATFEERGDAQLTTAELLSILTGIDEAPWATYNHGKALSARQLASKLKAFGVSSTKLRVDGLTPGTRGYRRQDFENAWSRYLPPPASATAPHAANGAGLGDFPSATPPPAVADEKPPEPLCDKACGAVADKTPLVGRVCPACDGEGCFRCKHIGQVPILDNKSHNHGTP